MYGVSFSIKYAHELGINPKECLTAALEDLGVRRLRLMSYWDEHAPSRGEYDFSDLDWQFKLAKKYGADITLAIGLRQPRWPESHWPDWATGLSEIEWHEALNNFIKTVITRYKDHPCLISWQLENEAMLKSFGQNGDFDRKRLKKEFSLVRKLDPDHPIIMTCSDSWGVPFFGPKPDMYGFSIYRYFYDRGAYRHAGRPPIFFKMRSLLIRILKNRNSFIHELQAEPWGLVATVKMPLVEQYKSMNHARTREAVQFAEHTGIKPVDLWGLEWWYWLKTTQDAYEIWEDMRILFVENRISQ